VLSLSVDMHNNQYGKYNESRFDLKIYFHIILLVISMKLLQACVTFSKGWFFIYTNNESREELQVLIRVLFDTFEYEIKK
jgi:hypothetical protein